MKYFLDRILPHISSLSLAGGFIIFYILGDHRWVDQFLPANGKPLVVFLVLALVIVYELLIHGQKQINYCLDKANTAISDIGKQLEINRLKQDTNSIYFRIKNLNVTEITNINTIKEINELKDIRNKLGVNSYTESRLKYLCSLIKL